MRLNRRGGLLVRASAPLSIDVGSIPLWSRTDMAFTVSLLGAQNEKDSAENKTASLLSLS